MVRTVSTMLTLGTQAPDFSLPDAEGKTVSLSDFADRPALLVIFMCNHCPFVVHILPGFVALAKEYMAKGVNVIAISSNDVAGYPMDGPELMKEHAETEGYNFPYLYDESQEVAKAYDAACTPDFYLFDNQNKLVYRGQLDDSRPANGIPLSGSDLRSAIDGVVMNRLINPEQKPSIGCNIKWK